MKCCSRVLECNPLLLRNSAGIQAAARRHLSPMSGHIAEAPRAPSAHDGGSSASTTAQLAGPKRVVLRSGVVVPAAPPSGHAEQQGVLVHQALRQLFPDLYTSATGKAEGC